MRSTLRLLLPAALLLGACASEPAAQPDDAAATSSSSMSASADTMMGDMRVDYDKSSITFVGGSDIVDHPGSFKKFEVEITPDSADSAFEKSTVKATIDLTSVTSDPGVTGHMLKADFFDTENHPEAVFESTGITKTGAGMYDIAGNMTIKGVTKPAVFKAVVSSAGMTAKYDLPRRDFGVGNDSYGNKLLDELVPVTIDIVFAS